MTHSLSNKAEISATIQETMLPHKRTYRRTQKMRKTQARCVALRGNGILGITAAVPSFPPLSRKLERGTNSSKGYLRGGFQFFKYKGKRLSVVILVVRESMERHQSCM